MDVDSPGGGVEGIPELADEIMAGRAQKKIVAVANGMAASAAYWLACCATELVVTPSGQSARSAFFAAHEDMSKALEQEGVKVSLVSAGNSKPRAIPMSRFPMKRVRIARPKLTNSTGCSSNRSPRPRRLASLGARRIRARTHAPGQRRGERRPSRQHQHLDQVLSKLGVKPAPAAAVAEEQQPHIAALKRRQRELDLHRA